MGVLQNIKRIINEEIENETYSDILGKCFYDRNNEIVEYIHCGNGGFLGQAITKNVWLKDDDYFIESWNLIESDLNAIRWEKENGTIVEIPNETFLNLIKRLEAAKKTLRSTIETSEKEEIEYYLKKEGVLGLYDSSSDGAVFFNFTSKGKTDLTSELIYEYTRYHFDFKAMRILKTQGENTYTNFFQIIDKHDYFYFNPKILDKIQKIFGMYKVILKSFMENIKKEYTRRK